MLCKNCNQNMNPGESFCSNCGTKQDAVAPQPQPQVYSNPHMGEQKYGSNYLYGGIILIIVAIGIYFWPTIQEELDRRSNKSENDTNEKTNTNTGENANSNTNTNSNQEENKKLSEQIDLEDTGARLVCFADGEEDNYVIGSKAAVFVDENEIVTRIISTELVEADDDSLLEQMRDSLEEIYDAASEYGSYSYNIVLVFGKLTSSTDIDYTDFDLKSYAELDGEIAKYLNEDGNFTLTNVRSLYADLGMTCTLK